MLSVVLAIAFGISENGVGLDDAPVIAHSDSEHVTDGETKLLNQPDRTPHIPTESKPPASAEAQEVRESAQPTPIESTPVLSPNIENRILDYLSHSQVTDITSISTIECTDTSCIIEFSGIDPNPQIVDEFHDFAHDLTRSEQSIAQYRLALKEISPNVQIYTIELSSLPVDIDKLRREAEASQIEPPESQE